jgi:hypothetical protein
MASIKHVTLDRWVASVVGKLQKEQAAACTVAVKQ